jgi:hypothetical protein
MKGWIKMIRIETEIFVETCKNNGYYDIKNDTINDLIIKSKKYKEWKLKLDYKNQLSFELLIESDYGEDYDCDYDNLTVFAICEKVPEDLMELQQNMVINQINKNIENMKG